MQRSALCRSRRELSNAYLLANIGVDTAENEHLKVWRKFNSMFIRLLTRDRDGTFAALDVAVDALVRNCFLAENYRSVVGKAQLQSADSYSFRDKVQKTCSPYLSICSRNNLTCLSSHCLTNLLFSKCSLFRSDHEPFVNHFWTTLLI